MTRHTLLMGLLLLGACGASRASDPPPSVAPIDTVPPPPPGPEPCTGACPGAGATCTRGPAWSCTCTEHADVNCGGAQRMLGPSWWAWSCVPTDDSADRGDGCPFAEPIEGSPCSGAPTCRYEQGPCGWSGVDAACVGGAWHLTAFMMPPPP